MAYQPPVSQVESQTVRWLFHGDKITQRRRKSPKEGENHPKKVKIAQRRWSRGWLFHGTNHPRMALPWKNHPKKVEHRIAKAVVARIPEMA